VLQEEPDDIAARGFDRPFNTAEFGIVLKTRNSPVAAHRSVTSA
jgi:hypothetical protein